MLTRKRMHRERLKSRKPRRTRKSRGVFLLGIPKKNLREGFGKLLTFLCREKGPKSTL